MLSQSGNFAFSKGKGEGSLHLGIGSAMVVRKDCQRRGGNTTWKDGRQSSAVTVIDNGGSLAKERDGSAHPKPQPCQARRTMSRGQRRGMAAGEAHPAASSTSTRPQVRRPRTSLKECNKEEQFQALSAKCVRCHQCGEP